MKSIFRYPGGKTKSSVKQKIFSKFPKQFDEFREPFVGGGGIFFDIPTNIKRWINDINYDLISVYLALRDNEEFIKQCREIFPENPNEFKVPAKDGRPLYSARLKEVFERLIEERTINPALSYFFINRTVWAGRVNYDRPSRLYFSNPSGWNIIQKNLLDEAVKILQNVRITFDSYDTIFEEYGEDVLIYCDPPYYIQTITNGGSQLYQHCFSEKDHYALAEKIKESKHKICLSYDDHDFVRKLYKGFNLYEDEWVYCGTSNKSKKIGKELIITNY